MADYSKVSIAVNGILRQIELNATGAVLVVRQIDVRNSSGIDPKSLTHALMTSLVATAADGGFASQNDLADYALTSTIGTLDASPTNYTPTTATVAGHLEGIDGAIAGAGGYLVKVSAADTTAGYLDGSITVISPMEKAIANPAANEGLQISLGYNALQFNDSAGLNIIDSAITTAKIADYAVTTAKIDHSAVTTDKIADSNVTTAKINDLAVDDTKLADNSVIESKILNGSVTVDKIGGLAVNESKIDNGAVTELKLGNGAVTESKLGTGAVTADKIGSLAVTTAKINDLAVTNGKLDDQAVSSQKLMLLAVTTPTIDNEAVTGAKIADGAVSTVKINDGAVTTIKINDGAITDAKVATGIDAAKIGGGFVSNAEFEYLGNVTSDIQDQLDDKVSRAGSSMDSDADISFSGGGEVLGLPATPSVDSAAASKAYVDAVALGLSPKRSVRAATTANITIATALNSGDVIDGITLADGDRVLVKDQSTASQNGIYVVSATPTRATDFDSVSPIDEINGAWVSVQSGTVNAYRVYVQYGAVATVGTDDINFEFYNPLASITGGDMVTVSGSNVTLDLASDAGLESSNAGDPAGQLRVKLNGATLDRSASGLKVADGGIDNLQLATDAVTDVKISNFAVTTNKIDDLAVTEDKLADDAVITIKIMDSAITAEKIADQNVTTAKIEDAAVTEDKISASVAGAGLTGGAGTALAVGANADGSITVNADDIQVAYSPATRMTLVAGEGLSANITYFVRWAITGETAGRIYKADKDATTSDNFYAFGTVRSGSAVSAGNSVTVNIAGTITLGSGDTNFAAGDVGKAVYLTAAGAFSVTAPTVANEAVFRVGIVQEVSKIYLGQYQLNYING
jgi:hypothetical protein